MTLRPCSTTLAGSWLLCFAAVLACGAPLGGATHDFRSVDWGMTRAEVETAEARQPSAVDESGSDTVLRYDQPSNPDLPGSLAYVFSNGRLVQAGYIASAQHEELNDYIADFARVEPLLAEKYGSKTADRAIWISDEFQLERLPYLEQDRAHASDILPSDTNAGLSVAMGHLRMYTERKNEHTRVTHSLTRGASGITHQIEYRSAGQEGATVHDASH